MTTASNLVQFTMIYYFVYVYIFFNQVTKWQRIFNFIYIFFSIKGQNYTNIFLFSVTKVKKTTSRTKKMTARVKKKTTRVKKMMAMLASANGVHKKNQVFKRHHQMMI